MRMLAAAAEKAKSLEPVKIALALEGMEFEVFNGGMGYMRKDDHQFFQPIYIVSFGELTNGEPFDEENTGWGWKVVETIETAQTVLPTTCKMTRPTDRCGSSRSEMSGTHFCSIRSDHRAICHSYCCPATLTKGVDLSAPATRMFLVTKQIPQQVGRRQNRPKPPVRNENFLPNTLEREPQPVSRKSEFKRGMICVNL